MINEQIRDYVKQCLQLFETANIVLPKEATVNVYHHLGREHIGEVGAMFINVVNRDYCKSYVVMLPRQEYPNHFHHIKTESYYVLYGDLHVMIDEERTELEPGDMFHVGRGQNHAFGTEHGVVFEEISTMYVPNDSDYIEKEIKNTTYEQRRTVIKPTEWKEIRKQWKK